MLLPYLGRALRAIKAWVCKYIVHDRPDEWASVDIYYLGSLGVVIRERDERIPEGSSPFFEWVKGKLFGYGDHDVDECVIGCLSVVVDETSGENCG